jgi:hypothetical protein
VAGPLPGLPRARLSVGPRVEVLGIRHHGPGSARSVGRALDELAPTAVLVEGAPELDAVAALVVSPAMVPPVAGLVYAVAEPRRASFYPLAVFSPEWVALRWALARGAEVRFADLPAAHALAAGDQEEAAAVVGSRPDPIATLAAAAGYDDPERWWEDAVEHRADAVSSLDRFRSVAAAMSSFRSHEAVGVDDDLANQRREAAMRRVLRATLAGGHERVAFVCGAYHAPVLHPDVHPPVTHDNALLKGLPKVKVAATWAPWTAGRLARASGYGAGVTAPGWYQHLFTTDDDVVARWMVRVAGALRDEGLGASSASVVEATRLADALAAVRGRPSAGLAEVTDAARAVLAEGSSVPLRLIGSKLVVGNALGSVPAETPMVPLAEDLARHQRSLRLKPSAAETVVTVDLRKEAQLARSVLLHRLALLGVDWGVPADTGRTTGTFKEGWRLEWRPELSVALIEASGHGTTIESAAAAKVAADAAEAPDLATLSRLIEACLLADLPGGVADVVAMLEARTAQQHDTLALLETIEPLARTCRYGDVRGADISAVRHALEAMVTRASVGLRAACASLDDDAAARVRAAIEATHRGVALLDDADLRDPWTQALEGVAGQASVHGSVAGRVDRLLLDADVIDAGEAGDRLSRRLSAPPDTLDGAAWLDGFLAGEAVLLLHDPHLLPTIDAWVAGIGDEVFEDLLPLLRRTFSRFAPAERRQVGEHLRRAASSGGGAVAAPDGDDEDLDLDRAAAAVAKVVALAGLVVEP